MFVSAPTSRSHIDPKPVAASRAAAVYGRFLQADPLGYDDGLNMYGYVGNDPVNFTDPTGMCQTETGKDGRPSECVMPIVVEARPCAVAHAQGRQCHEGQAIVNQQVGRGWFGWGDGGGGGSGSSYSPAPKAKPRPKPTPDDSPPAEKICKGTLALVGTLTVGGQAIEEGMHIRDALRGGAWGARAGSFAGPIGAAAGAAILGGGAYVLSKYGDEWLSELCKEK